jgi:hypothetical protein
VIGPVLDVESYGGAHRVGPVRDRLGALVVLGRQQVRIAVPARDTERGAGGQHAWSHDVAVVDRVAQRDVRVGVRTDVAHRRHAGQQRFAGIRRALQRPARIRNPTPVIGRQGRVADQMRVRIDQPR